MVSPTRRCHLILDIFGAIPAALPARAQQKTMPVIGRLDATLADFKAPCLGLRPGLSKTGYIEGPNVAIGYRCYDGLPASPPTSSAFNALFTWSAPGASLSLQVRCSPPRSRFGSSLPRSTGKVDASFHTAKGRVEIIGLVQSLPQRYATAPRSELWDGKETR
jgi:hypothetical protein